MVFDQVRFRGALNCLARGSPGSVVTNTKEQEREVFSASGTDMTHGVGEARDPIGQEISERVVGDADVDHGVNGDRVVCR